MEIASLSNYACLYTTDFQFHRKSNACISHINYVQLYETLHLVMAAHFQKVTETGQSLKQQKFEGVGYCLVLSVNLVSLVLSFCFTGFAQT